MLSTHQLTFRYSADSPRLHFPDIAVAAGASQLLLGSSGCGKTTLLHLLAGILTPQQGSVLIKGQDLQALPVAARDVFRGQHIGIIFQQPHFIQSVSVHDNLRLTQQLAKKKYDKKRIDNYLQSLELAYAKHKYPRELSVGEQQRLAIIRALINQPSVVLADEPTAALDDENTAKVAHLLQSQTAAIGAALVIVTHDARLKTIGETPIILPKLAAASAVVA